MALTEETIIDKIEILANGVIQIRKARIIYDNGKEVSRSFVRALQDPGRVWNPVIEDARLDAIRDVVWTPEVVRAREDKLVELGMREPPVRIDEPIEEEPR